MRINKVVVGMMALGLISSVFLSPITNKYGDVYASHRLRKLHHKRHDKNVYIVKVKGSNVFAFCFPNEKHKKGSIYLPNHTRLHVYNTIKKNGQTFYEIKSRRYVNAKEITVIE